MRVAMRRLHSAFRMFGPALRLEGAKGLLEGLKVLFAKLGEVREADVFIEETLPPITQAGLGTRLEVAYSSQGNYCLSRSRLPRSS